MAFIPCHAHGGMFPGGASTAFVRLVNGLESYGGRQKLCPKCSNELLGYLTEHAVQISEGELFMREAVDDHCMNCLDQEAERPFKLYVSTFPRGRKEAQWYGEVCFECAAPVAHDLNIRDLDLPGVTS
jgi:hypothetical protein